MDKNYNNIDTTHLELASKKSRIKAFIIDDLLITLLTIIMLWQPIQNSDGDYITVMIIMNQAFVQIILLKILYQTFFTWYYGATLGKMAAKTKIIDFEHFGRISFRSALIRASVRIISESIFYLGFFMAYYNQSRQTLHDKLAKTLVVNA